MLDRETISVYDSQIQSYVDLVKHDHDDPLLLAFIAQVKPAGYVLDLGCGPAAASATMRDHGLLVDPVDASLEMVQLANDTFDIGARQALFADIAGQGIYDGIWANFSLLHASPDDFPHLLTTLTNTLKTQGVFHLGMKLGQGSERDKLGRYYSYYSEAQLTRYLRDLGFTIDHVSLSEGKGLAGNIEPWIMLRATLPS